MSTFTKNYLNETKIILNKLHYRSIEEVVKGLVKVRNGGGRLFILGVGGSAATASHAVNDFRKISGIEAYTPTDNVAELTARINDESWKECYSNWLKGSKIGPKDAVLILSVGGGDLWRNISMNLVHAIITADCAKAKIFSIVGRNGGFAKSSSDACILIKPLFKNRITPHTEGITSVILHLLISHPLLFKG